MSDSTFRTPLRLAVVGAGASGTLLSIQVAEAAVRRSLAVELTLVDPDQETGRGVAYRTDDPRHLLNVPAGKMSCLPDEPDHFVRWLSLQGGAVDAASFVSRRLYGGYLADTLSESTARAGELVSARRLVAQATECSWAGDRALLRLSGGPCVEADCVVLATGSPRGDCAWAPRELRESRHFTADPWAPGAMRRLLALDGDVLLVGTGLTAVDVGLALARAGKTVHALSRHGRLPEAHVANPSPPVQPEQALVGLPLAELHREVRRHVRRVREARGDWRPAVDGLRSLTNQVWCALSDQDRAEFLRGHQSTWNVHRHRMPPQTAEAVAAFRRAGRLRVLRGQVAAASADADGLVVTLDDARSLRVAGVVDCTGPSLRAAGSREPLLAGMLSSGLVVPGPLGIGLASDAEGRLKSRDGRGRSLWAIGPTRRGELWETTAVPEIRQQAADLAEVLLRQAPVTRRPSTRFAARRQTRGATVWLTGLPSVGKTSIARTLAERLRADGHRVEVLDGHRIRRFPVTGLDCEHDDRDTDVRRVAMAAEVLARNGVLVLVPVTTPHEYARAAVRLRHDLAATPYVEVHVASPVEVRSAGDVKGRHVSRAAGEIPGPAGVDHPYDHLYEDAYVRAYEVPERPDLRIEAYRQDVSESAAALHALLGDRGLV